MESTHNKYQILIDAFIFHVSTYFTITTYKESIKNIDNTTGEAKPAYYMINCSHASHFAHIFDDPEGKEYIKRIRGVKPNGSKKSHKELNNSTTLDTGDPEEFGRLLSNLQLFSNIFGNLFLVQNSIRRWSDMDR